MKRILLHLVFWLTYLYSQIYVEYAWILHYYPNNTHFEVFMIASSAEYLLLFARIPMVYSSFYVFHWFINIKADYAKGLCYLFFILLGSTFLYRALVVFYILPEVYLVKEPEALLKSASALRAFLDLAFLFTLSNSIRLYFLRIKMKERESELMKQKVETELSLLKSQINPHFLFNTLNNIYGLALKRSSQTAPIVLKLSELMRFMLYESDKKTIPLHEEIKVLEDYIELETIRYSERLKINFKKNIDDPSVSITPLLFLPLVENAFTHGISESRKDAFIEIQLTHIGNMLTFDIVNSLEEDKEAKGKQGIGLKNVRRQLELIYEHFDLIALKAENTFKVKLEIKLNSNVV